MKPKASNDLPLKDNLYRIFMLGNLRRYTSDIPTASIYPLYESLHGNIPMSNFLLNSNSLQPLQLTPTIYYHARRGIIAFHLVSVVYFLCIANLTYSPDLMVMPRSFGTIHLAMQTLALSAHLVRLKRVVSTLFFGRAEYIPVKKPPIFYVRVSHLLCVHKCLVLLGHTIHLAQLVVFVQYRSILLIYGSFLLCYCILDPNFVPSEHHTQAHVHALLFSLLLDIGGGMLFRAWIWFTSIDSIIDITEYLMGISSVLPTISSFCALWCLAVLTTKLKPARSPQKIRRVQGMASGQLFDFPEESPPHQRAPWLPRLLNYFSLLWGIMTSLGLLWVCFCLDEIPPDCVTVLRSPWQRPHIVCASYQYDCTSSGASFTYLYLHSPNSLTALQFINCTALDLTTIERFKHLQRLSVVNSSIDTWQVLPSLQRIHLQSINVTSAIPPSIFTPSLTHFQLTRSNIDQITFPDMPLLQSLRVDQSEITVFNVSDMPRLAELSLEYNNLHTFETSVPISNLVELRLSGNPKLESIPDNVLRTPRITYVHIQKTGIESISNSVSPSLMRVFAKDTPLCHHIESFLSHAQVLYNHGDRSLVFCSIEK